MKNFKIIIQIIFVSVMFSCNQDTNEIFDTTPYQRMTQAKVNLDDVLLSQTNGWEMIYFPNVEELFSDVDKNVVQSILYKQLIDDLSRNEGKKYLGIGGYYLLMKFLKEGKVQMVADTDYNSSLKLKESEYSISQNTFVQLNFITPNYIFDTKQISFLFYEKKEDGSLIFTTNRYEDEGREYIVLRPLKDNESDWKNKMNQVYKMKKNYEDKMRLKPTLTILDEYQNVLFKSDIPQKDAQYTKISRRYALFMKNTSPNPTIPPYNTHYSGLGSGYIITDRGVEFLPGIRWNNDIIFQNFELENGKYISKVKGYTAIIQ